MKTAPLSRRDRLRHLLADLRLPGSFKALDAILHCVDGGTLTAPRRSSSCCPRRCSPEHLPLSWEATQLSTAAAQVM